MAGVAKVAGGAVVADWKQLIARDDVDAVIVSTPPSLHAEMCIAAAEAGKHVLCEKPLALDSREGQAIVDAAERCRVRIATGFNYRFYPSFKLAKSSWPTAASAPSTTSAASAATRPRRTTSRGCTTSAPRAAARCATSASTCST